MFDLHDLLAEAVRETTTDHARGAASTDDQRYADLNALTSYFAQHPSQEHLLNALIQEGIQASEERIRSQLAEYEAYARTAETKLHNYLEQQALDGVKQDRRQRIENIALTVISLIIGWCLSLLGSPLDLLRHFLR